jgi:4-amino-4-deoxy-L-arabinose transferase-like glycosyltransferase
LARSITSQRALSSHRDRHALRALGDMLARHADPCFVANIMKNRVSPTWFERVALATTVAALCWTFLGDLRRIGGSLPYPQHVDERPVLIAAEQILQTGDWNPHEYHYPALSIYIATAGLALGVISASSHGPDRLSAAQIGRLFGGFYERPAVVAPVRVIWALMGVFTLAAAAAIGFRLGGACGLLLTCSVLLLSTTIRGLSSSYVNVDTPLCLFMALCMAHLLAAPNSQRARDKIWIPGLLCGAAIASKYTGVVLLVPCLASIVLYSRRDRLLRSIALVFCAIGAFVLLCPYALLDLPHYVDGLADEAFHYGVAGHRHFEVAPGQAQLLAYIDNVQEEYGLALTLAAALGAFALAFRDVRRACVVLTLPVASLVLLTTYKVHFVRNALPLFMIAAPLSALGIHALYDWVRIRALHHLTPRSSWLTPHRIALLTGLVLVALIAPTLPTARAIDSYRPVIDSRNLFASWANARLPERANLIVPTSMPFATSSIIRHLNPILLDLRSLEDTQRVTTSGSYMLLPHWNTKRGWAAQQLARLTPGRQVIPAYDVIRSFDGRPVMPAKKDRDFCVNPGFDVIRIR